MTHGYIRRVDDRFIEIILIAQLTNDGYDTLVRSIQYLKVRTVHGDGDTQEQWHMRKGDYTISISSDSFYTRLLDRDFYNVKSVADSEDDIDIGVGHVNIQSTGSIPGDDDRLPKNTET